MDWITCSINFSSLYAAVANVYEVEYFRGSVELGSMGTDVSEILYSDWTASICDQATTSREPETMPDVTCLSRSSKYCAMESIVASSGVDDFHPMHLLI